MAHARHRTERRVGRPVSGNGRKRRAMVERSGCAHCRAFDGDVQIRAEARCVKMVDCGSGVRLERGVECRLSDGTTLISDHYYPMGAGPWPTLLMRQPYGRAI